MSLHRAVLTHLESLTVTQGPQRGEPFEVLPWERRFLRGAFGVEDDVALSVARGNGKTCLVAAIACAILDPLHAEAEATDAVIAASSFSQGLKPFRHVQRFLAAKGYDLHDRKVWRVQDPMNAAAIEYRRSRVTLACIESDPRRAHGAAPSVLFADELAQWEPSKTAPMLAALACFAILHRGRVGVGVARQRGGPRLRIVHLGRRLGHGLGGRIVGQRQRPQLLPNLRGRYLGLVLSVTPLSPGYGRLAPPKG